MTHETKEEAHALDLPTNSIDLSGRVPTDAEFAAVIHALNNNTLTALDLCGCNLGLDRAIALANALKTNKSLRTLDLSNSGISPAEGILAIIHALNANQETRLEKLDLSHNNYGAGINEALATLLENNKSLTMLGLSFFCDSPTDDLSYELLFRALQGNTQLKELYIGQLLLNIEELTQLSALLETNHHFKVLSLWRPSLTVVNDHRLRRDDVDLDEEDAQEAVAQEVFKNLLAAVDKNTKTNLFWGYFEGELNPKMAVKLEERARKIQEAADIFHKLALSELFHGLPGFDVHLISDLITNIGLPSLTHAGTSELHNRIRQNQQASLDAASATVENAAAAVPASPEHADEKSADEQKEVPLWLQEDVLTQSGIKNEEERQAWLQALESEDDMRAYLLENYSRDESIQHYFRWGKCSPTNLQKMCSFFVKEGLLHLLIYFIKNPVFQAYPLDRKKLLDSAMSTNKSYMARFLLEEGKDPDVMISEGNIALHSAILEHATLEHIQMLLDSNGTMSTQHEKILFDLAVEAGELDTAFYLYQRDPDSIKRAALFKMACDDEEQEDPDECNKVIHRCLEDSEREEQFDIAQLNPTQCWNLLAFITNQPSSNYRNEQIMTNLVKGAEQYPFYMLCVDSLFQQAAENKHLQMLECILGDSPEKQVPLEEDPRAMHSPAEAVPLEETIGQRIAHDIPQLKHLLRCLQDIAIDPSNEEGSYKARSLLLAKQLVSHAPKEAHEELNSIVAQMETPPVFAPPISAAQQEGFFGRRHSSYDPARPNPPRVASSFSQ